MKRALAKLLEIDFDVLIPGHGPVGTKKDVQELANFMRDLESAMRNSLKAHKIDNTQTLESFLRGRTETAPVMFEVEDALRPKYGHFKGFDGAILSTAQWCYLAIIMGDA